MAAMSRGPGVPKPRPVKHTKGGTEHTRNHRFESFSQRIAKLKIEPIRRGRSTIIDEAELDAAFSYFKNSLTEWRDLNISENFNRFARQVAPLCESLPQILHHSDRILDLLVEYIEKGDKWSEEPLLGLMAHFAHDLGARFEHYFERAVKAISQLAAKHEDFGVIEWSFACLAWLFKYLSRLLVPDLRPLFDLMAPLLGKTHQKPFVTKFAAESLSFLVRKAGAMYHKDQTPLKSIIRHISEQLKDLQGTGKDYEFRQGLMALFADSMKGIQRGLHSSAVAILQELLLHVYSQEYAALHSPPLESIVLGVLTAIIHHTDETNFAPLQEVVVQHISTTSGNTECIALSAHLLYTICGVRHGDRIRDWKPILTAFGPLFETIDSAAAPTLSTLQALLSAFTVVFQYCPLDVAIPHVQYFEKLTQSSWEACFLPFCNLFADMGPERFQTLLLPYFKKFVSQKAYEHGPELCVILPQLHADGALLRGAIQPSARWHESMLESFTTGKEPGKDDGDEGNRIPYTENAYLEASRVLNMPTESRIQLSKILYRTLEEAVELQEATSLETKHVLATGNGFRFLVEESDLQSSLLSLWPAFCRATPHYGHFVTFWEALFSLLQKTKSTPDLDESNKEPFKRSLMHCLGSPSHDLRLTALRMLELVIPEKEELQAMVATAMMIEDTPLNLETVRSVSMRIRQLAKSYPTVCSDEWVGEAIPTFCFGLLHVKFAQVWDDACSALKDMCATKEGEAHVSRVAFQWLENRDEEQAIGSTDNVSTNDNRRATEFECTNVMQLDAVMLKHHTFQEGTNQKLKDMFDHQHPRTPFVTDFSRVQALRVLNLIPQVAEKRSRSLVPILLEWGLDQPTLPIADDDAIAKETNEKSELRWTRKDQKAMLSVFSKFVNPKVLYKTTEVYEALLMLLANGDIEIQKASLQAILTWKDPAIVKYQENLFNLLDDARFREEISVFMDVGEDESHLQHEHREQLLPVILRLMYGKIISGKKGQEAKRRAVFAALTRFENNTISQFLDIAFGPLSNISIVENGKVNESVLKANLTSPRKQVGMLNMLEDMLNTLKTAFAPFTPHIVDPLLYCLIKASRGLSIVPTPNVSNEGQDQSVQISLLKTIRQRAFHSLNIVFESCPEFQWDRYIPAIIGELVTPRLSNFPIETAQSVSGLLRLFGAWAKSLRTASFLVEHNPDILTKVLECLEVQSGKDEVKRFVLDEIIRGVVALVSNKETPSTDEKILRDRISSHVLQPYAGAILHQVGDLLRKSPSKEILESAVQTVAEIAPLVTGSTECRSMIEIAAFLIRQPSRRVTPHTKLGLLHILHEFIPRCDTKDLEEVFQSLFDAIVPLFAFFRDQVSRVALCNVLQDLADHREDLEEVARLCEELNSFSVGRLDEPDFERRSVAFNVVSQEKLQSWSVMQWQPIVYNMLWFIKDNEELSIRVNASLCLRIFLDASTQDDVFQPFITSAILPGIHNGMREPSELVRVEYLAVLGHLVKLYPTWAQVSDMQVLLSEDDESSFFVKILHIQGHRRLRAMRRLATSASRISGGNTYHILIPLLEAFIFSKADDENANNLAGEATRTISIMSEWLEWPQYRSLLKRFIGYLTSKEDMQKTVIKLIGGMMSSLNKAGRAKGFITNGTPKEPHATTNVIDDEDAIGTAGEDTMDVDIPVSTLTKTLPQQEKLTTDLISNILPSLSDFLRKKDDTSVSLRVPIAIAVAKVLLVLPPSEIEARLPAVLLDVCHILKSKSQDARDMARNTLAEIATETGPEYVGFILKSLRTALQRGYQLHVLSFTFHHILVRMTESGQLQAGELNYCLVEIVDVIMDDIFGVTGQEKDAEEYISKMKEVKISKSYDSMDIVARTVTPTNLIDLISPVKSLLLEKLNARIVTKIDELLRRIGLGVLQNPTVKSRDILVFCYELIQGVYKTKSHSKGNRADDQRNRRYLVNMRGAAKSGAPYSTSSYTYKMTRFGLDILRTVLKKHEELQTPQNVAGFLPMMGDALVQGQEEIQISAMRLLTTIIKAPLPALDRDCPVYITEAVRTIKGAPSTNTEIAQASLKMIAAILRERPDAEIKEKDLALLLKRLLPDLDEPDRQGIAFGFIKAIMNRKVVIAEVYEVMDKVATIMVTNHTKSSRDLARASYFYFLMEYPQAKNRFSKQLEFLIRNLRYDYEEGRQSVMEALNLILTKVGDDVLQDVLGMVFIPLIHSMANDDSSDCRTMAGALVKKVFERADSPRMKSFMADLRGWLEQDEDSGLKRLGIQCWGLSFEVGQAKPKELAFVLEKLQATVEKCLERREEDDWELIYYSLTVFLKMCKSSPESALSSNKEELWTSIRSSVSYPHAWVKLSAAKLLGIYFGDLASTSGEAGMGNLPLEGSQGLALSEDDMLQLTNAFLRNISMPNATEELCAQSVRNLAFLGRCFALNGAQWDWHKVDDDDEVEEGVEKLAQVTISDAAHSDDGEEEEWGGLSPVPTPVKTVQAAVPTAIHRLMTRLSGIIRRETKIMKLSSLFPKTAVMTLLETLSSKLPPTSLTSCLPHLLTTLNTLTDPATTIPRSTDPSFNDTYKALIDKAREVMNILQKQLGTAGYLAVMQGVQKNIKQRREDRKNKRKVEAVTMPEKYGREKQRRREVQKVKKKERSADSRGKRRGW
ncbi:hypothetical protein P154DRAFT_619483 [Amniculicola lignicola CBS 123094]|uniref:Uncharacterized protein n=1 Tax=Amniculicola lignicola CBS 123094 TaxID=1392246 RepID=A0A6A5WL24_9PLEO|nr:hypothetical protein P154DRAFT_619483 [Amniculicola lignicola CBS 123094]